MDGYTVGELARMSHVSVRTLHHYDSIGLLTPSGRSPAGYRLYSGADLRQLRQILFYRELEFGLDEIAEMLAAPDAGADDQLRRQHRLLRQRQARTQVLLAALEKEMEARKMGISLTPEEQFEIFGTSKLGEYAAEAEQRWGDTDAWQVDPDVPAGDVLSLYRREAELADGVIAATPLDTAPLNWPDFFGNWRLENLRAIILHVITETATHAGHLDAARELIDGRTWLILT